MLFDLNDQPQGLECPKCGKKVLVKQSRATYRCLWCGFHRDISGASPGGWQTMVAAAVAIGILLLML